MGLETSLGFFLHHLPRIILLQDSLPGATILQLEPELGYDAEYLSRLGATRVVGLQKPTPRTPAVDHLVEVGTGISAIPAEPTHLPFADSQFDIVFAFESLASVQNLEAAISELNRVMTPTGLAVFATSNFVRDELRQLSGKGGPRVRSRAPAEVYQALSDRFQHVTPMVQSAFYGETLLEIQDPDAVRKPFNLAYDLLKDKPEPPLFYVFLASNEEIRVEEDRLVQLPFSYFADRIQGGMRLAHKSLVEKNEALEVVQRSLSKVQQEATRHRTEVERLKRHAHRQLGQLDVIIGSLDLLLKDAEISAEIRNGLSRLQERVRDLFATAHEVDAPLDTLEPQSGNALMSGNEARLLAEGLSGASIDEALQELEQAPTGALNTRALAEIAQEITLSIPGDPQFQGDLAPFQLPGPIPFQMEVRADMEALRRQLDDHDAQLRRVALWRSALLNDARQLEQQLHAELEQHHTARQLRDTAKTGWNALIGLLEEPTLEQLSKTEPAPPDQPPEPRWPEDEVEAVLTEDRTDPRLDIKAVGLFTDASSSHPDLSGIEERLTQLRSESALLEQQKAELDRWANELKTHESTLAAQRRAIADRALATETEVSGAEASDHKRLAAYEETLNAHARTLQDRGSELDARETRVSELEQGLTNRDTALSEREQELERLMTELHERQIGMDEQADVLNAREEVLVRSDAALGQEQESAIEGPTDPGSPIPSVPEATEKARTLDGPAAGRLQAWEEVLTNMEGDLAEREEALHRQEEVLAELDTRLQFLGVSLTAEQQAFQTERDGLHIREQALNTRSDELSALLASKEASLGALELQLKDAIDARNWARSEAQRCRQTLETGKASSASPETPAPNQEAEEGSAQPSQAAGASQTTESLPLPETLTDHSGEPTFTGEQVPEPSDLDLETAEEKTEQVITTSNTDPSGQGNGLGDDPPEASSPTEVPATPEALEVPATPEALDTTPMAPAPKPDLTRSAKKPAADGSIPDGSDPTLGSPEDTSITTGASADGSTADGSLAEDSATEQGSEDRELEQLRLELAEAETTKIDLLAQRDELQAKIDGLYRQREVLDAAAREARERANEQTQVAAQVDVLRVELAETQAKLERLTEETEAQQEMAAQAEQLEKSLTELQSQLLEQEEATTNAMDMAQQAEERLDELEAQLTERDGEIEKLQEEVQKAWQRSLEEDGGTTPTITAPTDLSSASVGSSDDGNTAQIAAVLAESEARVLALEQELEERDAMITRLQKELDLKSTHNRNLQEIIGKQREDLDKIKGKIREAIDYIGRLHQANQSKEAELNNLRQKLSSSGEKAES